MDSSTTFWPNRRASSVLDVRFSGADSKGSEDEKLMAAGAGTGPRADVDSVGVGRRSSPRPTNFN